MRFDSWLAALGAATALLVVPSGAASVAVPDPWLRVEPEGANRQSPELAARDVDELSRLVQALGERIGVLEAENRTLLEQAQFARRAAVLAMRAADDNKASFRAGNAAVLRRLEAVEETAEAASSGVHRNAENVAANEEHIRQNSQTLTVQSDRLNGESSVRREEDSRVARLTGFASLILLFLGGAAYLLVRRSADRSRSASEAELRGEITTAIDGKLATGLEEISTQLANLLSLTPKGQELDHTLALKVADEMTRIRNNLSRMPEGTRGYKQITGCVRRIGANLEVAGYRLTEHLGLAYDEELMVEADFFPDESRTPGERIITRVVRPEVRYEGKVVQTARLQVSVGV